MISSSSVVRFCLAALVLSGLCLNLSTDEYQVRHVVIVRRHSSRNGVIGLFDDDPDLLMYGQKKLTHGGRHAQYDQGLYIRNTYPELIRGLEPEQIEVTTVELKRCIESANLFLNGLLEYPIDNEGGAFLKSIPFHFPDNDYELWQKGRSICEDLFDENKKRQAALFSRMMPQFETLLQQIKADGIDNTDFPADIAGKDAVVDDLYDILQEMEVYIAEHKEFPPKPSEAVRTKLINFGFLYFVAGFQREDTAKVMADTMARKIIHQFEAVQNGTSSRRITYYSTRRKIINMLSAGLGFLDTDACIERFETGVVTRRCLHNPSFGSAYTFELSTRNGQHFVKTFFENEPLHICEQEVDSYYCSLAEFTRFFEKNLMFPGGNIEKACFGHFAKKEEQGVFFGWVFGIGVSLIISSAFFCWIYNGKRDTKKAISYNEL